MLTAVMVPAWAQQAPQTGAQELLRQQARERALREQQEARPDARLPPAAQALPGQLPADESPCFRIDRIELDSAQAARFVWALKAANPAGDPATGRCLGAVGISVVMKRVQNAIVARGYVTTRVLAPPQDLKRGTLGLTVVPGRVRALRLADGADHRATVWNALPTRSGALLNLRDIEQGLENLQRVPTVTADIQITPAESQGSSDAQPGQSDLVIAWKQRLPVRASLSLDDSGSQATGKLQAGATVSFDDLLRWNDLAYVNLVHGVFAGDTRATSSWTAHYDVPFGYWLMGATASGYDYRQAVAGAYETYVYSGESNNAELRVARLLFRNATMKSGVYGRGWWRQSKNDIDGTEIQVQRRRMAGWEVGLTHKHFLHAKATLEASLAYRRGTGAFAALPAPEEAFGEGTSRAALVVADGQLVAPFQLGAQALRYTLSWRAQWNRTPLVPQDRFAIGGRYTVRGFDGETSLIGERGWLLRNELGVPLGGGQEAYWGLDYGHVGGPSMQWQPGDHLAGTVIGLRGGIGHLAWDVFAGGQLSKPAHFATAYTPFGFSLSASY